MESRRIVIIDGHPDADPARFVHALAARYADGAAEASHHVETIRLAELEFPLLASRAEWEGGDVPAAVARAQTLIERADHVVILYPLWLGDVPAKLKGFFEQVMRPGFAFAYRTKGMPERKLKGRSARIVVTMGMPGIFYRLFFRAHSVKSLERNILSFVGFRPIRRSIIGNVEGKAETRMRWLQTMFDLGRAGR